MSSLRVSRIGENLSVAMAMITSEGVNDTRKGFNTFHTTKNFVRQILTHAKCLSMVVR